ncbi:MAG: hypothetical protein QM764_17705 [Chitinophagaceae bacterium]
MVRLVRPRVVGIVELIDEVRARRLARDSLGEILVILRMTLRPTSVRVSKTSAPIALRLKDLLAAHLVRHDENQAIAFLLRDERKAESGITGGAFDERRARV